MERRLVFYTFNRKQGNEQPAFRLGKP